MFDLDLTASNRYFVSEKDQIRMIDHPDRKYDYKIHNRAEVNDLGRDAYNGELCDRSLSAQQNASDNA